MKKKIAVVTGATGGMGSAICRTLNRDGYTTIGQYRNNHDKAESLQHDIRDSGGEFHPIACDLTSPAAPDVLADAVHRIVEKSAGAVHVVVNNAAKLLGPSLATATVDQFDEYFAVNVRAPFFLIQALLPLMPAGGSIVNISSAGAHFSSPGDIVYAMSKAALESLTRNLAEDIAKRGIRINTVVPGFTDNGHEAFKNPAVLEYMSSFAALGGVAQPDVIAHAVSFLASDLSNRTTGTILDVSGGSTIGARNRTAPSVRHIFETPPAVPVE